MQVSERRVQVSERQRVDKLQVSERQISTTKGCWYLPAAMKPKTSSNLSTDAATRLQQLLEARVKRPLLRSAAEPKQMPLWPSSRRAVPNEFARSALFTCAGQREPRAKLDGSEPIVSTAGFELYYSGEELRQDDLDLWLQVVDMAQGTDLVHQVEFTASTMLALLGWGLGEASYQRLRDTMKRLNRGHIAIVYDGGQEDTGGAMLLKVKSWRGKEMRGQKWWALIDRELVSVFRPDMTLLDWETRRQLGPLAKWLHTFYSSHREPHPIKVETLYRLCGSKASALRTFRAALKDAVTALVDIGFLAPGSGIERPSDHLVVKRVR